MERFSTVVNIIALPAVASDKELTKRASAVPDFHRFVVKLYSKKQIKQIKQNMSKASTIQELFAKNAFPMDFDPIKLKGMLAILNTPQNDRIIYQHFSLFTLHQYIAFILSFESTFSIKYITVLFSALIVFSNLDFQQIMNAAICDIFSVMMDNYSHGLFLTIFDPLSNFLLINKDVDSSIYSFLPMLLKRVIDDSGYSHTSDAARLSSLLSLLLLDHSHSFTQTTIDFLYEVIRPHLQAVNEFALIIMQNMRPFLNKDQVNTFFLDLPSKLPQIIESLGSPFIEPPQIIEFETFNPSPSPECHFRFPEVNTFENSFDASSSPQLPTPTVVGLVCPKYYSLVDLIVKVINDGADEAQLFLDSLTDLVDAKSETQYKYDYLGIMALYWIRLTSCLPIEQLKIPKILFEPTISIFDENMGKAQLFFSIRFYSMNSLLKVADPHLDKLLLESVKYPHLLTELVEICNLNLDKISILIMNQTWMIRTVRLIALQLQSAEFNHEISVKCIEGARLSVFRLIFRIFIKTSFVNSFLNDVLFLSFFLSLLFEENVRPFVLSQLKTYIACKLSTEQYEIFLNQLCQVLEQTYNVLPDKKGLNMILDILSTLTASKTRPELMVDMCSVLRGSLQYFDNSDLSRFVLFQIISFFTMISKTTSRLPNECIKALEAPLKKFENLGINDFNVAACLLASNNLKDYNPTFKIKNGDMLNIMFSVFYINTEVDIVDFAQKLCKASIQNCYTCHQCHFDLTLIDFLMVCRDNNPNDNKIPEILTTIATIACVISSPVVVQRFISLFIPIENRYISNIHHLLLKPLLHILTRAQERPSLTLPLNHKRNLSVISSKNQLEKEGITFTFWLYYISGEETQIFSLLNGDEKPFFSLGMKHDIITIDGNSTSLNIPKKQWKFVSFAYQNGVAIIYLDAEEVWKANMFIKYPIGVPSAKIGENNNTKALLGNFGLFDSFGTELVKNIYELGPRSVQIKRKPLFYYTQENMIQLTGYSLNTENRTFTDVLFRFFKIEILLPLFAQLNLPLKNGEPSNYDVIDVVSVFKAALYAGELEQYDFGQVNGFSIIAHLLCSSSHQQITFKLYSLFFEILEILILEDVRKELFQQIIMNFDLWMVAKPEDHIQILQHWKKVIFPKYQTLFIEFLPFSYLLDILRIYYWYEPIEKSKIRSEPDSSRPRDPNLNITECRSMLYNIMYDISTFQFRNEDFSALMEHVITLEDEKQQLDLLCFMNGLALAPHLPMTKISNTIPTLSRISNLFQCNNDDILTAAFNVIYSIHSKINSNDLSLIQHIDALMKDIEMRKMSLNLLEDLMKIMLCNTPLLFPLVTYVGYRLGTLKVFEQTPPSANFVVNPNWALWAVAEAMTLEEGPKRSSIYTFLARCSIKQWQSLYDTIEIASQAIGIPCDSNKACLLKGICQLVLASADGQIPSENVVVLFGMIKHHMFYRKHKQLCSASLNKLVADSPFREESDRQRRSSIRLRPLYQIDILNLALEQHDYMFGLRMDSNSKWRDEELCLLTLRLMIKYRKSIDELSFGFVLAAFLIHSNPAFVNNWLTEMQLAKVDCDAHLIESQFLVAKANSLNESILIKTQIEEAYNGSCQLLENIPTIFFDINVASSSATTYRGMKTFSQTAANNLFLVQQQETRNAEFENDINLATEIIRSNDERISKLWQRLWSNVVVDGAPWDPSKITGKRDKIRWKRSTITCKHYCLYKMKRNRKYTNHIESSIARDAGNAGSYNKMLEDYKRQLEEEYQKNAPPELLEIPPIVEKEEKKNDLGVKRKKKKRSTYPCELIKMTGVKNGTFTIFSNSLHIDIESTKKTYNLPVTSIAKILLRRRFHIKTAIEIFMDSGRSYFVNFPQYKSSQIVQRMILPEKVFVQKEDAPQYISQSGLTEKWVNGKISNFEYLMNLNIISGRSFNDSSQYPFFPWVIGDYTSETLDLNNPNSFRDLSKPIGAIGEDRFRELVQRMNDMHMFSSIPYMYSSFSICPLSLYLWLFRMEPFTSLHIEMQSGKFDHPSRLFSSIPDSYGLVTTHMNDYRELAPEFYFLPEFLTNENDLDLGKAKGVQINDVILPKWAKSSEECVYIFRKALESDTVSRTLSKWIDLVWGYKQRGESAKEANNMYMPDMYETAWTPQVLQDPRRRAEIEASMCHVGQMPPQLFTTEHPSKIIVKTKDEQKSQQQPQAQSQQQLQSQSQQQLQSQQELMQIQKAAAVQVTIAQLPYSNIVNASLTYTNHLNLSLYCNAQLATLTLQATTDQNVSIISNTAATIRNQISQIVTMKRTNEVIALIGTGKLIHMFDGEIDFIHQELTNVSSIASSGDFFAAVSDDTTFNIFGRSFRFAIPFYGDSITCCAISNSFKIAVCGTISGNIVVCSLFEGRKVNVIQLEGQNMKPTKLLVTKNWGFIVTYAIKSTSSAEKAQQFLFVHNINGKFIRSVELTSPITTWCSISSNKAFDYIVISSDQGKLHLLEVFYLNLGDPFYRCYQPVVAMLYLKESSVICAVKTDGNVIFYPICVD